MAFNHKATKIARIEFCDDKSVGFVLYDLVLYRPEKRKLDVRNWRGHQTSPTVVSLKGRLPKKLQSKSPLSSEIVQIHSLFRHAFIKKPKSRFHGNRK